MRPGFSVRASVNFHAAADYMQAPDIVTVHHVARSPLTLKQLGPKRSGSALVRSGRAVLLVTPCGHHPDKLTHCGHPVWACTCQEEAPLRLVAIAGATFEAIRRDQLSLR